MERWDLYDENRKPLMETMAKHDVRAAGKYFVIVCAIMQNENGDFLLQKRSKQKGSQWALTGGHPKSGETSLEGLITEVKEELGIILESKKVKLLFTVKKQQVFADIYHTVGNFSNAQVCDRSEVEKIGWFTSSQIKELIKNNQFYEPHIPYIEGLLK